MDLRIESGESAVIIGRSGGGKSVLLKHLIGLLQPDAGEVLVDGENITRMNERQLLRVRRKFGMVFQGAALFDSMTVAENVAFGLRRHEHLTEAEIAKRVAATLDMVDLPGTEKKKPAELSGGMRKRVGLARAIIYEPQIVLYDEPTTGLDPIVSDSIDQLIIRVRDQLKVTSVVVTHDMRSARRVGNHVFHAARQKNLRARPRRRNCSRRGTRSCGNLLTAWRTRRKLFYNHGKIAIGIQSRPVCVHRAGAAGGADDPVQQGHQPVSRHLRFEAAHRQRRRPQAASRRAAGRRARRQRASTFNSNPGGTNVTVTLQIYKDYPIYHDARFVIEQSGFLGDQYVSVVPTANTLPVLTNDAGRGMRGAVQPSGGRARRGGFHPAP